MSFILRSSIEKACHDEGKMNAIFELARERREEAERNLAAAQEKLRKENAAFDLAKGQKWSAEEFTSILRSLDVSNPEKEFPFVLWKIRDLFRSVYEFPDLIRYPLRVISILIYIAEEMNLTHVDVLEPKFLQDVISCFGFAWKKEIGFDEAEKLDCFVKLLKLIRMMSTEMDIESLNPHIQSAMLDWDLPEEFELLKDPLKLENGKTKLELLIDERRSPKRKRDDDDDDDSKKSRVAE